MINLWELEATSLFPLTDPGLAPWVPLTKIDGPPEPVLQYCRDVIEANSIGGERDNLLNATEILAGLRFDKGLLRALFRRGAEMIESPVLQEWFAERDRKTLQGVVLKKLEARFGPVPADVSAAVRVVTDPSRLESLIDAVYSSATLDAFRLALTPPADPTN